MAEECVSGRCTKEGRPCPVCGGEVPPSLGNRPRKYCSPKCLRRSSKPAKSKQFECKRCGVQFASTYRKDYCNKRCRWPRQVGDTAACAVCRGPFQTLRRGHKFCSDTCRDEAIRQLGARTAERNRARAKRYCCQNCGRQFVPKNKSRCAYKFCSRDCAFEARRLKKQCAKRPIYAYRAMASWFLAWGDDQWPRISLCECGCSFVSQASDVSEQHSSCTRCRNKKHKMCPDCGGSLSHGRWLCTPCAAVRKKASRRKQKREHRMKHGNDCTFRQRCKKYGCPYTKVSKQAVMERDDWKCRLCGHKLLDKFTTVMDTRTPHPRSPTIDHVVPLSFGPSSPGHVFDNCQAACWQCNCERGTEAADSFAARKATQLH